MRNKLVYAPAKDERKVKRTIGAGIGFIGILLTAGILFTIFLLNSSVASDSSGASYNSGAVTMSDSQKLNANASPDVQSVLITDNQRKAAELLKMAHELPAKRKAAAERLKATLAASAIAPASVTPGPGLTPDYFGIYPNYANSPLSIGNATVTFTGVGTGAAATATVVNGVVTGITLTNGGSGYTSAPTISITGGSGTGATATATVAGAVAAITITNGGTGYISAPTVTITGGGGTGATATATVAGSITSLTFGTPGAGYTAPAVSFSGGGGAGATATATGPVDVITVTNGGTGYTAPAVSFSGGGGAGATATATADPTTGAIASITLISGGSGYTSAPTVTITDSGTGSGATATATIAVTGITLGSGGSGYISVPAITITDSVGTGSGATATATVTTDVVSAVTITNGGSGYTSAPTVTFTGGGGSGAAATATIKTDVVSAVTITSGGSGYLSGGIRKFVDAMPSLPIAVPDTITYPGSDYYEIALQQYTANMHSDLPATTLRGYVQLNMGTDANGQNTIAPAPIQYLGPVIVAQRDRPVRVKFINQLPNGSPGDLFIPVDTTYMGAGTGPAALAGTNCSATPKPSTCYSENRATLHLHGGTTPWISDGTPHQWTTPAGETTSYPEGVSVFNVPDMDGGKEPNGTLTFYYSNQQSARLMFYHDHAYGITRLNVYGGEAAGYLLTDSTEQALIGTGGALEGLGVGTPLVIQDKTFVPDNTRPFTNLVGSFSSQLAAQDPTWDTAKWGGTGSLWFPHVYMPNQNPGDVSGANPMGRWDYGPWFWPPFTGLTYGPILNPYYDPTCVSSATQYCEGQYIPGTPDARLISPSGVPEAFMDTPLVNGKAYPVLNVPAGPVRFRILNAANDRFWNLQMYVADPNVTTADGRKNTEVKMVPFNSNQNLITPFPSWWYTPGLNFVFDDRAGGVPDPTTRGPAMIQIGTEGGFLPAPAVILNQPVNYVYNRRDITVLNVNEKALFLGPAERADVIVDFSKFAGKTLILYNDAPAPVPATDPRIDYYTGDPDQTDTGGAPSTLPGYGPNTRTIMQIKVAGTDSGTPGPVDDVNQTILTALNTALPAAFNASQDTIIVPQAPYNGVYNANFPGNASAYVKIQDTNYTFDPIGPTGTITMDMEPKAIIEDFTMDYGRMNAILGNEIKHTNVVTQTSIIQAFIDPPVELINITDKMTPIGNASDGTQIWKITHNGVDTHAIHFHLFNVQLVNRVGWDGAIKPPDANELGWKDTVRMNPLEDIIVALRPIKLTNLPFKIPNSWRPLDVTSPLGSTAGFTNVDPNGNPTTVTNQLVNFGWEFVYHCHLLGHEENDMMRPVVVAVPPEAPSNLTATLKGGTAVLTWIDNSLSETGFTVQRSNNGVTWNTLTTAVPAAAGTGSAVTYSDKTYKPSGTPYFYRVFASNTVGSTVAGYSQTTVSSASSNIAGPPSGTTTLSVTQAAALRSPVVLTWTYSPGGDQMGFVIQRATNASFTTGLTTVTVGAATTSYTDSQAKARTTYYYRVMPINFLGVGSWSNVVSITPHL
ncbi:MAG: hypothetical protein OIN66_15225 [Candidatus Methanoperedens sp.]|nr:hypothetical protein [Candidatus Methanoperedens sp.]